MTPRSAAALRLAVVAAAAAALASGMLGPGCADVTRFSNTGDHYEGIIDATDGGDFIHSGFTPNTTLCLELDASHLQDTPGTLTSGDKRFSLTPLRTIPQIWHDPLSTLTFGEGRLQNLVYMITPVPDVDALGDVTVVLSLMQSGSVEVRLFRGAPTADAGVGANNLFGVFSMTRAAGLCSS